VTLLFVVHARAAAVSVPAKLRDAVPIVEVRINGSGPLWFALDTGSSRMLIDASLVDTLGLTRGTPDSIHGAGAGAVPVTRIAGEVSFTIGTLTSRGHELSAVDLSRIGLRDRLDGILGYDFLRRHVITIDYARGQVTIDPDAIPRGSREVPIRIDGKWPFVTGTLLQARRTPIHDTFLIDTGSGDAVDHPRALGRPTSVGHGLGEPVPGRVGNANFELAGFLVENVAVASGSRSELGQRLIGGGLLSHFVVTFDYAKSKMYLLRR